MKQSVKQDIMRSKAVVFAERNTDSTFTYLVEMIAGGFGVEAERLLAAALRRAFLAGGQAATELEASEERP